MFWGSNILFSITTVTLPEEVGTVDGVVVVDEVVVAAGLEEDVTGMAVVEEEIGGSVSKTTDTKDVVVVA